MKKAFLTNIENQDGAYLAHFLCQKGYEVSAAFLPETRNTKFLELLGIVEKVQLQNIDLNQSAAIEALVKKEKFTEIYNLYGQSSVALSFEIPKVTLDSIINPPLYFLEAIRKHSSGTKFFNLGSSDSFGENTGIPSTEESAMVAKSPYALGRAISFQQVELFRNLYGIFACTGIVFSHDSPLRPDSFVTKKVISNAIKIANVGAGELQLGDLSIIRDWGWAPEYIPAYWQILQQAEPKDFVLATGESHSLEEYVAEVFAQLDLDWKKHVKQDPSFFRSYDVRASRGNPAKANEQLQWRAKSRMKDIIRMMILSGRSNFQKDLGV